MNNEVKQLKALIKSTSLYQRKNVFLGSWLMKKQCLHWFLHLKNWLGHMFACKRSQAQSLVSPIKNKIRYDSHLWHWNQSKFLLNPTWGHNWKNICQNVWHPTIHPKCPYVSLHRAIKLAWKMPLPTQGSNSNLSSNWIVRYHLGSFNDQWPHRQIWPASKNIPLCLQRHSSHHLLYLLSSLFTFPKLAKYNSNSI